jgi:hypothetical protein
MEQEFEFLTGISLHGVDDHVQQQHVQQQHVQQEYMPKKYKEVLTEYNFLENFVVGDNGQQQMYQGEIVVSKKQLERKNKNKESALKSRNRKLEHFKMLTIALEQQRADNIKLKTENVELKTENVELKSRADKDMELIEDLRLTLKFEQEEEEI